MSARDSGGVRCSRAIAAIALVTLLTCAGCDRFLSVNGHIERAQRALDAGQLSLASNHLTAALAREPDNATARILRTRFDLKIGDVDAASGDLARAVKAGARPDDTRELQISVLFAQRRFEDAIRTLRTDSGFTPLRRAVLMANAQMSLGRRDAARQSLDEAMKLDPNDQDLQLAQAHWLIADGQLKEAGDILERLHTAHPDFARADLASGQLDLRLGDATRAADAFERARKRGPFALDRAEQVATLVGLIESRLILNDLPRAEAAVKLLEASAGRSMVAPFYRARYAMARRDFNTAVTVLQKSLATEPDNPPSRMLLGAALTEQGLYEQAGAELSKVLADHPENVQARKLLAKTYLLRNDPASAQRTLGEAPANAPPDPESDVLSGTIMLMSGQTGEGTAVLEQAVRADPHNVPARLNLARAYLVAGHSDDALAQLNGLPAGAGGAMRQQLTVLAETAGKSPAEAKTAIDKLLASNPKDAGLRTISAYYLIALGDEAGARRYFGEAIQLDGKNTDARLGLASLEIRGGKADAADAQLRSIIKVDPSHERAYLGLAGIAFSHGDRAGAQQWLEKAISLNPSAVESRLLLAQLMFIAKDPVKAGYMLDQALAVTRARGPTLNRVGQILMQAGQPADALARFEEAASLGVQDGTINAAKALIAQQRYEEARNELEGVLHDHPASVPATALLVMLDAGQGRIDDGLSQINAFTKAGGAAGAADEMRGEVLMAAKRYGQAADAFESAARSRPSGPLAIKTFNALKQAGKPHPEAVLIAWLEKKPMDIAPRLALAEQYQRQGDRTNAIAQYELVTKASSNPAVLNNLAWLYYEANDARAPDVARRAYVADPHRPEIADTYGWILTEQGKVTEGLKILEAAQLAAPNSQEIHYHYAAALAKSGKTQEAAMALRQILQGSNAFPSRSDAEALLKTLT